MSHWDCSGKFLTTDSDQLKVFFNASKPKSKVPIPIECDSTLYLLEVCNLARRKIQKVICRFILLFLRPKMSGSIEFVIELNYNRNSMMRLNFK